MGLSFLDTGPSAHHLDTVHTIAMLSISGHLQVDTDRDGPQIPRAAVDAARLGKATVRGISKLHVTRMMFDC